MGAEMAPALAMVLLIPMAVDRMSEAKASIVYRVTTVHVRLWLNCMTPAQRSTHDSPVTQVSTTSEMAADANPTFMMKVRPILSTKFADRAMPTASHSEVKMSMRKGVVALLDAWEISTAVESALLMATRVSSLTRRSMYEGIQNVEPHDAANQVPA